jgi:ribosomal protein S10
MPYKLQIISYDKKILISLEESLRQLLLIYSRSWNVSLNLESKILSKFRFLKRRKRFTVIRSPHVFKKSQEHFAIEQ